MSKKALVHLLEFDANWETMSKLPEDHIAAISVLCYAVSEVNALARIYLSQSHEYIGERAIDSASNIQRFVILRSWSAKLFEIEKSLQLGGKKPKSTDIILLELADGAKKEFEKLATGNGYNIARDIRHEATNHYSFKAAKKNLGNVPANIDCNMYLHEIGGNSFYPLGEAVMFHARLDRRWAGISHERSRDGFFNEWLTWNLDTTKWLMETHANFTDRLVFNALGRNEFKKRAYWVPEEFTAGYKDRMTPVFLAEDPT